MSIFKSFFLLLTPSHCHCLSSRWTSSEMQFSDCGSSTPQKCSRSGPKGNQTAPQPKSAGRTILRHSHVLIRSKNKPGPKDSQQQQQWYWAWSNRQRCAALKIYFKGQDANCSFGFARIISQTTPSNQQHSPRVTGLPVIEFTCSSWAQCFPLLTEGWSDELHQLLCVL